MENPQKGGKLMHGVKTVAMVAFMAASAFGDVYYVNPDASKASDAYDGKAAIFDGTHGPKQTLAGVMAEAKKSGDVVYAAEGVYEDGVMTTSERYSSASRSINNRVVVPAGVTLRSESGAAKTFIVGAPATGQSTEADGCGEDSFRCVKLGDNARIVGFTLTGGRAPRGLKDATSFWNAQAGGVHSSDSAVIADCILSNNVAYGSGIAGVNGSYLRCRIVDNIGTGTGAVDSGSFYDCYVNGNSAGGYQLYNLKSCVNTTFGTKGATPYNIQATKATCEFWNCALLNGVNAPTKTAYHRCAFSVNPGDAYSFDPDCFVLTKAECIALGDGGEPFDGSPFVDAGSNAYHRITLDIPSGTDVVGNSRVSNGRIDIGCCEFDYRPVFARTLNPFGAVSVAEASSNVLLVAEEDELALDRDASLTVDMGPVGTPARYRLSAEVLGNGTLSIRDGEVTVASLTHVDGRKCVELTRDGAARLHLSYSATDEDDAGARVSDFSNAAYVIFNAPGEGITLGGINAGTNVCAFGSSITFTATRRPVLPFCTGITVDGVLHEFGENTSLTLAVEGMSSRIDIASVYEEHPSAWYVDANDGDDANLGLYPANAMRTLEAALTNVNLKAGDVVWALPGSYAAGRMMTRERYSSALRDVANRAVVGADVMLRSTGGAAVTFIEGESIEDEDDDNKGCGVDSVRCVYLEEGASLIGFTVRGGRAPRGLKDATTYWNATGGGVYSSSTNSLVADCILSNNVAHGSGNAGSGCTYVRCRVVDNETVGVSAIDSAAFYDCYVNRNAGAGSCQLRNPVVCVNTTFGLDGMVPYKCFSGAECEFYNSLFLGGVPSANNYSYHRCAFAKGLPDQAKVLDADCIDLGDAGALGDGLVALPGTPLVDGGSNTYHTLSIRLDGDVCGVPRILNKRIDIGAAEYDWRTDYSSDICGKAVVTEATPNVVETDAKNVRLEDGDAVTLVWKKWEQGVTPRRFRFSIAGGELVVRVNGEQVAALVSDGEWVYEKGAATDQIEFMFTGSGQADILKSVSGLGLVIYVR